MRAVIQRVSEASVTVAGEKISAIGEGLLILLGIEAADGQEDIDWLAGKIARLRIFGDQNGAMNLSLQDTGGAAIVVSQFTLHGATKKGNRPSFIKAAHPSIAEPLYEDFIAKFEEVLGKKVGRGSFGAMMDVQLINDGPVTLIIDTKNKE
jgi:D-tyrosyl-tRNA(Tyr) deacylase